MAETLTTQRLDALRRSPPRQGRIEIVDTKARGLEYRVTPKGKATWSLSIFVNGRRRRFAIGEYPIIGLAEARRRAERLRAEVKDGRDPVKERQAARQAFTVASALEAYSAGHLAALKDGKRRAAQLRAGLERHLQEPIAELTRANCQAAIDAKGQTAPVAANRLKAALNHFAVWCHARGHLAEVPKLHRVTREHPRDRVLSLEELAAIWRASLQEGPVWGPFIRFLMLTAQRREDVAGMRVEEIDGSEWRVPAHRTKNRRPHIVHLSAAARSELRAVQEFALCSFGKAEVPQYVFTLYGNKLSGFGRLKKRLDRSSGVRDWRLHDFRTAFASHCAGDGIAEGVVDRVLNHAASGSRASAVARTYQRNELLSQRQAALEYWATLISSRGGAASVPIP